MKQQFKTNQERASALGLKPAPTIKGYYWSEPEVDAVIDHNRKAEESRAFRGSASMPRLLTMFLDLTPSCNLRCPRLCYSDSEYVTERQRATPGLSLAELKYCVDVAKAFGANTIVTAGRGEPFLDPNALPLARYIGKKDMWWVVFTNCTRITPRIARTLDQLNVSVVAKMNSLDPETQDRIVGVKGAQQAINKGVINLIGHGLWQPRLAVESAIFREILDDLVDVFRYCREMSITPYFEALIETGKARKDLEWLAANRLTGTELTAFFKTLRAMDESEFGYTWTIPPGMRILGYGSCRKNMTSVTIRPDGEVYTCVNDMDTRIGNMRIEKLDDLIVNSPILRNLRLHGAACCSVPCARIENTSETDQGLVPLSISNLKK